LNRTTIQIVALGIVLLLGVATIAYQLGKHRTRNFSYDSPQSSPAVIIKEIPVIVEQEIPVLVIKEVPVQRIEVVYLKDRLEIPSSETGINIVDSEKNRSQSMQNGAQVIVHSEKSSAIGKPKNDPAPIKPTANDENLRGGFRIGGHARYLDSLTGLINVDDIGIVKTINVHILQDSDSRYFFDPDSLTVPAGQLVKFVVHNTHFTPDECW